MTGSTTVRTTEDRWARPKAWDLKTLVGSGEQIGALALPFLVIGIGLNVLYPAMFGVGGPPAILRTISLVMLVPGVVVWAWSVALILAKVPKRELITSGPFALVKHPLYTGVGLLVLPWAGFLLDTWLGALLGIVLYVGTRLYARTEEQELAKAFGSDWDAYEARVLLPWL